MKQKLLTANLPYVKMLDSIELGRIKEGSGRSGLGLQNDVPVPVSLFP